MKHLVLKFGLNQLKAVALTKGWEIPYAQDLDNEDIEYDCVWVLDEPEDESIRETHGIVWDKGKRVVCNKNFMQHAVVFKTSKTCPHCGEEI